MSRIDELQRLHEAATPGEWEHAKGEHAYLSWIRAKEGGLVLWECNDMSAMDADDIKQTVALHNSWPAIHRVLLAAREVAANEADDIDSRLRYVEVRPGRDEWRELVEALRALDGGA